MTRRRRPDYELPTLPEGDPVDEPTEEFDSSSGSENDEAAAFESLSTEALFHEALSEAHEAAEDFEAAQATELLESSADLANQDTVRRAAPPPTPSAVQPNRALARARFRDALVDIRAGNFPAARKNLNLAAAYAPDQRSPEALLALLAHADRPSDLEDAWGRVSLVGRYGVAAAFGVPLVELRDTLVRQAELYGLDLGRPSTVEQLLAGAAALAKAGARPDGEDDPVPFTRLSPRL